jgi:hypothetical protein
MDERVRIAAAPFDHPQIFVPTGTLETTSPSGNLADRPSTR